MKIHILSLETSFVARTSYYLCMEGAGSNGKNILDHAQFSLNFTTIFQYKIDIQDERRGSL